MKYILPFLILLSIQSFAQIKDTTKHILTNKDTLLTIKTTANKTTSVSYTETSVLQIVKAFQSPGPIDTTPPDPPPPTTPGKIEGFGADVTGGSGSSTVYRVTNLNTSGSGSLANGIGSNKTILFDVSGTIKARINIYNVSNLTIDAYTSKQDITIDGSGLNAGDGINVDGSTNIFIRGLRVINCSNDGLNATGSSNKIVFDHCTSYGHGDGNLDLSATGGKNFTVQWCFIGKNNGSGLMLGTTQNASIHHNLFAGGSSGEGAERNPYFHSNYSPVGTPPNFDFRNNLVQSSGRYASGNGYKAVGNYVNNYYVSSKAGLINLCADNISCGTAYVSGNFNQPTATGGTKVSTEYAVPAKYRVTTTDAKTAARAVLQSVGTWRRTPDEQKIIDGITVAQ